MDYDQLLTLVTELGFGLSKSGAEIYRVEESIQRLLMAYGIYQADPFAIPNCIFISFVTPEGVTMNRVRRVPYHGTDVDLIERYNDLCRKLCRDTPPLEEGLAYLREIDSTRRVYSLPVQLAAYIVSSAAFVLFFHGDLRDALCGGICGLAIGLATTAMSLLRTNPFFKSMAGAAISALLALGLTAMGLGHHSDRIIIGALMALVPGVVFTNAIRDVMAGDMVAGISKLAEALLTGIAVALGTGSALLLFRFTGGG